MLHIQAPEGLLGLKCVEYRQCWDAGNKPVNGIFYGQLSGTLTIIAHFVEIIVNSMYPQY
jgi:hypothetical protein